VTLLREALKILGVEEQLRVATVRDLVVYDLGSDGSAGV